MSYPGVVAGYLKDPLPWPGKAFAGECVKLPLANSGCGCYVAECALGNLVADSMRWMTNAEIGLINGGAIRAPLPAGAVEGRNLVEMLPFQNEVLRFSVTGARLRMALKHGLSTLHKADAVSEPSGRFLHLSGLRIEWRFEEAQVVLDNVEILRNGMQLAV